MGNNTARIWKAVGKLILLTPVILVAFLLFYKGYQADAAVTGTVTATSLFVREGPGSGYDILKLDNQQVCLAKGDYVAVSWEENGWYYITAGINGKTVSGYVNKTYISASGTIPTGKPSTSPTPTVTGTPQAKIPAGYTLAVFTKGFPYNGVVVATTLNIRDGAGTNFKIIDTLKEGDRVTVSGVKKSSVGAYWYTVTYVKDGKTCTGITSASYVAVKVDATKTPTPTPIPYDVTLRTAGFPLDGKVAITALNVRSNPGTSSSRVAILVSGDPVTVIGVEKDSDGKWWYHISYTKNGVTEKGYVLNDYLSVKAPNQTYDANDPEANIVRYYEIPAEDRGTLYYSATVKADLLNLRSKAVDGSIIVKIPDKTKIIILERQETKSGYWYKAAAKLKGKVYVGYVSADYVSVDYDMGVYGLILKDGTLLRNIPNGSSAIAVDGAGREVSFARGEKVKLTGEAETGGVMWFKVSLSDGTEGYIIGTEAEITGGNVSTLPPTPTPTPTPRFTATPTPLPKPTGTPKPSGFPTPVVRTEEDGYPINFTMGEISGYGTINSSTPLPVLERPQAYGNFVITYLKDSNDRDVLVNNDMSLVLYDKYIWNDILFRQIVFTYNGQVMYGYIEDKYITPFTKAELEFRVTPTPAPDLTVMDDVSYFEHLERLGFPLSYIDPLIALHAEHPNWIFEADIVGLDWDTVIEKESKAGLNLIPNSYASGFLSTADGAYDWMKDQYKVYDSPYWVTASKQADEYYIDPRNWLDSSSVFMFETLSYKEKYQTLAQVEELLKGTPFYNQTYTYTDDNGRSRTISYAQTFIEAAEYSGVSPYHLVTRVRQEVVTGSSTVSNSASGKVSGYEGYYNFYNIGAYHSTTAGGAIVNGLKYAKNGKANEDEYNDESLIPWDNQYRAIVGGAYIIAQQYIARGQDTIYLQKFNVTEASTFGHQYMANIEAPKSEAAKMAKAYTDPNTTVIFKIPVYDDMPEEASAKPTSKGSPNNVLSGIYVYDLNGNSLVVAPSVNPLEDSDYYITTTQGNDILQIVATAVSDKAVIEGTGTVVVTSNTDVFEIKVTAENGDVRVYRIHTSKRENEE